jgi:hypothetical protein
VFKNKALKRIFGLKGQETKEADENCNKELHNLYSFPYINKVMNSKRM